MKKSNVIIFVLLAIASAFLLWLWYYLGLNKVDEPLDLVLSILWWIVIIASIVIVAKMEQIRRRRIRTVYVGNDATFNSEKGLLTFAKSLPMQEVLASILENLSYNFSRVDFPDKEAFEVKYFVRTKEFKVEKPEEGAQPSSVQPNPTDENTVSLGQDAWKGEVVIIDTKEEKPFESPEELADILASLEATA